MTTDEIKGAARQIDDWAAELLLRVPAAKGKGRPSEGWNITTINNHAGHLVKLCAEKEIPPPPSLVKLTSELLGSDATPPDTLTEKQRQAVREEVKWLCESGEFAPDRIPAFRLAKRVGVEQVTVRAWRDDDEYCAAVTKGHTDFLSDKLRARFEPEDPKDPKERRREAQERAQADLEQVGLENELRDYWRKHWAAKGYDIDAPVKGDPRYDK